MYTSTYIQQYQSVYPFQQQQAVIFLTFRGPCLMIYSYNKRQRDALFLKFILIRNSTCFGQIYCPSNRYLSCRLCWLFAGSEHNLHDKNILLCIQCWDSWLYAVNLSKTCRVLYQNKLENTQSSFLKYLHVSLTTKIIVL